MVAARYNSPRTSNIMRRASRRHFLEVAATSVGMLPFVRLGTHAHQADPVFRHGVASGDPLADRVMLWTRVTTGRQTPVEVRWNVATDPGMKQVVARGEGLRAASRDFTVKVDVTGLSPATPYYYRFESEGGRSPVGRTRTLPVGATSHLRVAVVSCSNYPFWLLHRIRCDRHACRSRCRDSPWRLPVRIRQPRIW